MAERLAQLGEERERHSLSLNPRQFAFEGLHQIVLNSVFDTRTNIEFIIRQHVARDGESEFIEVSVDQSTFSRLREANSSERKRDINLITLAMFQAEEVIIVRDTPIFTKGPDGKPASRRTRRKPM